MAKRSHALDWLAFAVDDVVERVALLDLTLDKRQNQVFVAIREYKAIEWIVVPFNVSDAAHIEAPYNLGQLWINFKQGRCGILHSLSRMQYPYKWELHSWSCNSVSSTWFPNFMSLSFKAVSSRDFLVW